MKHVLFVGHDATRTGAPIVLLHFLRWLKDERSDLQFELLLLKGGELEPEYRRICKVSIAGTVENPRGFAELARRVRRRLGIPPQIATKILPKLANVPDLIVGNTILSLPVLAHYSAIGIHTLAWVHEMERLTLDHYASRQYRKLCDGFDRLVFASERAAEVKERFGVRTPHEVIYEFVPPMTGGGEPDDVIGRLPADAFVVLGCGTIEPRKGVDLFVDVAREVTRDARDAYFVWLGAKASEGDEYWKRVESATVGNDRIVFAGPRTDVRPFFDRADVFALTSLEDPFPLVVLEAANFAVPTVCFERAGGIPEFVGDDAGKSVPYGDPAAFGEAIKAFYVSRAKLRSAGEAARRKFENEFSMESSCRRLAAVIDSLT